MLHARTCLIRMGLLLALAAPGAIGAHRAPPQPQPQPDLPVPVPWPYPDRLAMVQRDVLQNVTGRLDHMALDLTTRHLYVAAPRNNSLEVLHVPDSDTRQSISDLPEPAGVLLLPDQRRVVVACSGESSVRVFLQGADAMLTPERTVRFADETDSLGYDAAAKRVYVTHGAALGSLDPATGEKGPDVPLGGTAKALALEPAGARIFLNVPSKRAVVVVDRATNAVSAEWSLVDATGRPPREGEPAAPPLSITEANFPMALDAASQRLFVVTRVPARLFVLDTRTGRHVAEIPDVARDADDCWYDAATRRVFISGGGGSGGITAVRQKSADDYDVEFRITTASGARTSLLVPEQRKLYVAAPRLGDDPAYIFVYLIGPPP